MDQDGISSKQKDNFFDLSPFWKENEALLKELERSETPARSRLIFKEISHHDHGANNNNRLVVTYDLVNIYDNRKNFFSIRAELSPDGSSIIREEIVAGSKLSDAKKTIIEGSRITNKDQIAWIKAMGRNDACRLFRT